jgi:Fic family protein
MINDRQKLIIDFAKNQPIFKHKDVVYLFKNKYSRATITRDLSFLVAEDVLIKNGKGAHSNYSLSNSYDIIKVVNIEKYFAIPYEQRKSQKSFNFDIFNILEVDLFTDQESEKLEALQQKFVKNFSRYDSQTLINKEFERIMIEFSWKSSAIEGNTYSLLSTEALIKENIREAGKTEAEAKMILNHKDAFNESIQNRDLFLDLKFSVVEYIHTVLTKELGIAKNIRNLPVGITGTKYKPPDNSFQIKEALEKMIKLINNKASFFEKSFLLLVLISYIQAFEDGNKRTARMLSNAVLLAHNSIPLSYRIIEIKEYKKASLLFYETNNISYLKKIFIDQFEDSVGNYF